MGDSHLSSMVVDNMAEGSTKLPMPVGKGATNWGCLDVLSMTCWWTKSNRTWSYNQLSPTVGPHQVDTCLVVSGPARNTWALNARQLPFQNCLAGCR